MISSHFDIIQLNIILKVIYLYYNSQLASISVIHYGLKITFYTSDQFILLQ